MAPGVREDTALWPHVLSGMAGRVCAETFVSPFNLVKVRLQHDLALKGQPLPTAFIQLSRSEGLLSLWRGLPPRLMWATPMAAATFTYYHAAKTIANGSGPEADLDAPNAGASETEQQGKKEKRIVLLGPVILAAAVAVRTPFDIAEQKLQITHEGPAAADPVPAHVRAIRVLRGVWQTEGVRGLWRGYSAALCGNMSYVVGYFFIYEAVRRGLGQTSIGQKHEAVTNLLAGGLGGGITAGLATPFDTVKVRMQTKVYATEQRPNPSMLYVWRTTVREVGSRFLWRGLWARVASNAPSGAIMFTVYEVCARALKKKRSQQ